MDSDINRRYRTLKVDQEKLKALLASYIDELDKDITNARDQIKLLMKLSDPSAIQLVTASATTLGRLGAKRLVIWNRCAELSEEELPPMTLEDITKDYPETMRQYINMIAKIYAIQAWDNEETIPELEKKLASISIDDDEAT